MQSIQQSNTFSLFEFLYSSWIKFVSMFSSVFSPFDSSPVSNGGNGSCGRISLNMDSISRRSVSLSNKCSRIVSSRSTKSSPFSGKTASSFSTIVSINGAASAMSLIMLGKGISVVSSRRADCFV